VQCAWAASRTKNTYLRSKYDSLVSRRGKKKALIAVGRKILIAVYYVLRNHEEYNDLGADYLESRKKMKAVDRHIKMLTEMGYQVELKSITTINAA